MKAKWEVEYGKWEMEKPQMVYYNECTLISINCDNADNVY